MFSDRGTAAAFPVIWGKSFPPWEQNIPALGTNPSHTGNKNRAGRIPASLNVSSNMQQLTLQFDGYAPIGQAKTQGTAKQCKSFKFFPVLKVLERTGNLRGISLNRVISHVKLFSQAAAAVTFGFGLIFLAALIGG